MDLDCLYGSPALTSCFLLFIIYISSRNDFMTLNREFKLL